MPRSPLDVILGLIAIAAAPVFGADGTISVTGSYSVAATPDMATFDTAVVTQSPNAGTALKDNSVLVERLLQRLQDLGVKAQDVQTAQINLNPQYESSGGRSEMVGYQATNQVRVTVHKIEQLGTLLDEAVKAGSNRLNGIRFGISDPGPALDEARQEAFADARKTAQLYAATAGLRLGPAISIREGTDASPTPQPSVRMAARRVPIAPGQQNITATVHVVFALDD